MLFATARPTLAAGQQATPIPPDFARELYGRLAPLQAPDGCRLVALDTKRVTISLGLRTPSGAEMRLTLAAAPASVAPDHRVGDWMLQAPEDVKATCGSTLAAIEQVLHQTAAPQEPLPRNSIVEPRNSIVEIVTNAAVKTALLTVSVILLLAGTLQLLYQALKARLAPRRAVLALIVVWVAALALRLSLSPRTFLHEYYHIAETLDAYQSGESRFYGDTGPALFHAIGTMFGRSDDPRVIFVTNAVIASLAIPAVALLAVIITGSWAQALCAAVLLCVLPQHVRFSASEDVCVQAVTFGMWALALFLVYIRTRRFRIAVLAGLALSLAMQTRPEMLLFPAVLLMLALAVDQRSWRVLASGPTVVAVAMLVALLIPRFVELQETLSGDRSALRLWALSHYLRNLVLFELGVTPAIYWVFLAAGAVWAVRRMPAFTACVFVVYVGYSLLTLSMGDSLPSRVRLQILPTSFMLLLAGGIAPLWMTLWGHRRRVAEALGAGLLVAVVIGVVVVRRDFVTELADQQLEFAFLNRTVPQLADRGTLLSVGERGGRNLDAFPEFLLRRAGKNYTLIDIRQVAKGDTPWPAAGDDRIYYQGMYCYFALPEEPPPDPMTAACRAVHEHYALEPLAVETLHTHGYSDLRYAGNGQGPFHIGFFRMRSPK